MKDPCISENIAKFSHTKKLQYLAKAAFQIFQQGRIAESIYGLTCSLLHHPGPVGQCDRDRLSRIIGPLSLHQDLSGPYLSRSQLMTRYGRDFAVLCLPEDFAGARRNSIVHHDECLIIGEYGHEAKGSRIALMTGDTCLINDYYGQYSNVFHIHALFGGQDHGTIMVTTGDSAKFLDLWELAGGDLVFVKRMRKGLAGYTAIARVNGQIYFGTDFSGRPNYIETLEGEKFFFPDKAYRKWVLAFWIVSDRYLVSINAVTVGEGRTISIFDTAEEEFIFCEDLGEIGGQRRTGDL